MSSTEGPGEALGIKAADGLEGAAADCTDPCPEGLRIARAFEVDLMVKEVAKARDGAWGLRAIVVGAEDRVEAGIGLERRLDPPEGVGMDDDVGVDEGDQLALAPSGARITRRGGAGARWLGDAGERLGGTFASSDRIQAALKAGGLIGRRNDAVDPHGPTPPASATTPASR